MKTNSNIQYPAFKDDKVNRRRFISILGKAASVVAIAGSMGCKEAELQRIRLPESDVWDAFLSDDGEVGYVLYIEHENSDFTTYAKNHEVQLLEKVDQLFSEEYTVDELSVNSGISDAQADIQVLLEESYSTYAPESEATITRVVLEIHRLKKILAPDGAEAMLRRPSMPKKLS